MVLDYYKPMEISENTEEYKPNDQKIYWPFLSNYPSPNQTNMYGDTYQEIPKDWVISTKMGDLYEYGYHTGDDITHLDKPSLKNGANSTFGEPVISIADGIVVYAGPHVHKNGNLVDGDKLNVVVILHQVYDPRSNENIMIFSRYMHIDSMDIKAGDHVVAGQQIGKIGDHGRQKDRYDDHLHFDIMKYDKSFEDENGNIIPIKVESHWAGNHKGSKGLLGLYFEPSEFLKRLGAVAISKPVAPAVSKTSFLEDVSPALSLDTQYLDSTTSTEPSNEKVYISKKTGI